MLKLLQKGLFACGTIRQNRQHFPNDSLTACKLLKMGQSDFAVADEISVYKWKDRGVKSVMVASNMHNATEMDTVLRTNKNGKKETVQCPKSIADYNRFMGGVDRFDHLHSLYSISWKSRRWWLQIIYYLML